MREIKFRAWDEKRQEWGWRERFNALYLELPTADTATTGPRVIHLAEQGLILEQYTGLKDKNGKEIYEGDIFEAVTELEQTRFVVEDIRHMWWRKYSIPETYNVIGNIHENPDLLKKGKA